jgi:pimeloyl-ACP methyl ester carboxylesterase
MTTMTSETQNGTLTSPDGTTIGWTRTGQGPAVVLVDGALCYRGAGPLDALAAALADQFAVWTYDRRGRGTSGDTLPFDVAREVEDLRAVVGLAADAAGCDAGVYGISSGAVLALRTAAEEPRITRLALYEPPLLAPVLGDGFAEDQRTYTATLRTALDEGRRGDAVALFLGSIGVPAPAVAGMRSGPGWPALEAIAPTIAYDDAVLAGGTVPATAAEVRIPTLVVSGGASPVVMQDAAKATAAAIPGAEHRTLPDQTHDVSPDALAPVLVELFAA